MLVKNLRAKSRGIGKRSVQPVAMVYDRRQLMRLRFYMFGGHRPPRNRLHAVDNDDRSKLGLRAAI